MPGVRGWRDGNPGLPRGAAVITSTRTPRSHETLVRLGVLEYLRAARCRKRAFELYPLSSARSGALHDRRAAVLRADASGERQRFANRKARALTKPN